LQECTRFAQVDKICSSKQTGKICTSWQNNTEADKICTYDLTSTNTQDLSKQTTQINCKLKIIFHIGQTICQKENSLNPIEIIPFHIENHGQVSVEPNFSRRATSKPLQRQEFGENPINPVLQIQFCLVNRCAPVLKYCLHK
jgi:hypothetical protein